jgi:hypothetical protein
MYSKSPIQVFVELAKDISYSNVRLNANYRNA